MATSATRPAAMAHDFDSAFDGLLASAYSLAYTMVGESLLAEELAVEALARTRIDWARIVRRSRPDGYIARVVTMLAIDALARREPVLDVDERRGHHGDDDNDDEQGSGGGVVLRHDEARALRSLPRRRREVVALWCYAGFTKPDVAAILGMPLDAVEAELEQARGPLQQALSGEPGEGTR